MEPEQYKLIQQVLHQGFVSMGTVVIFASLLAAGVGAYFGSYLKKKAEIRATDEGFGRFLDQLRIQTDATERIRGQILEETTKSIETLKLDLGQNLERFRAGLEEDLQKKVETLRDALERERVFDTFSRNRLAVHLDRVLESTIELGYLSDLVGKRTWAESAQLLETERGVYSHLKLIKMNVAILRALNAIHQPLSDKIVRLTGPIWFSWGKLTGELALTLPTFRKEHPNEPEFSPSRYQDIWCKFCGDVKDLEDAVLELPPSVLLPK